MSILVYYTRFETPLLPATFTDLLAQMPPGIKARILSFRRWQDAHACLLGRCLLLKGLSEFGYSHNLAEVQYLVTGKPYLTGAINFNIAHSGTLVVCAMDDKSSVGIDIEEIREISIEPFRDCFSVDEWNSVILSESPLPAFYRYWTIKEAVLKAHGAGLHIPLASVNIKQNLTLVMNDRIWHLKQIEDLANYACHIATNMPNHSYRLVKCAFK